RLRKKKMGDALRGGWFCGRAGPRVGWWTLMRISGMYRAPVEDIAFTLKHVAGLKPALEAGTFGDLGEDLVDAILMEAGRFASDEVAPLYKIGDEQGAVLKDAIVTTPRGWKELYRRWID